MTLNSSNIKTQYLITNLTNPILTYIQSKLMASPPNQIQPLLLNRQDSFYIKVEQDDDIQPHELSGDQSSQQSVIASELANAGKSNFVLTVTTIMKTVIGAGIISLPSTMTKLGYLFGILIYVLVIIINQFTSIMLLKAKNLARHSNYSSIMCHLFNSQTAKAISSAMIMINNLGICIAELTIFKGAVDWILIQVWPQSANEFYTDQWFIILVLAVLEVSFTIVHKIQKLKFMAFLGVAGIVVFIICLMITFFDEMFERQWTLDYEMKPFPTDWLKVATVIPNIMLALAFQMNFFPIYKGLKNSNDSKMQKACLVALSSVGLCYLLVGLMGSAMYGPKAETNFLLNLTLQDLSNVLFWGMNGGFLLSIFFSFPVMFFGARNNFIALMQMLLNLNKLGRVKKQKFNDSIAQISSYIQNGTKQQKKRKAQILFYIYSLVLFAIVIGIAIGVQDVESVFNLVGSIASNAIGYILPCMFYYLLIKYKGRKITYKYHIAKVIFFFFIPFGIFAAVSNFVF